MKSKFNQFRKKNPLAHLTLYSYYPIKHYQKFFFKINNKKIATEAIITNTAAYICIQLLKMKGCSPIMGFSGGKATQEQQKSLFAFILVHITSNVIRKLKGGHCCFLHGTTEILFAFILVHPASDVIKKFKGGHHCL